MTTPTSKPVSKCCGAEAIDIATQRHSAPYYVCKVCGKPCDLADNGKHLCVPGSQILLSNPPQHRCETCGRTWVVGQPAPTCSIQSIPPDSAFFPKYTTPPGPQNILQPTPQNGQEEWEKEFEEIWRKDRSTELGHPFLNIKANAEACIEESISFIRTLLSQREAAARREEREKIEKEIAKQLEPLIAASAEIKQLSEEARVLSEDIANALPPEEPK